VVFVARDDPLDHYLAHHPRAVFGRPVEATVTDPANPYVLGPSCAARRRAAADPGRPPDFGGAVAEAQLDSWSQRGAAPPSHRLVLAGRGRPDVDIRGSGLAPVTIIEGDTGRLLGTVDGDAAHATVHTGAVYVHRGETYVVDEFCVDDAVAVVHPESPGVDDGGRDVTDLAIVATDRSRSLGTVTAHTGVVDVTNQVVAYQRRRLGTGEVLAEFPLDLPARQLRTRAVWLTLDERAVGRAEVDDAELPGSLHAAEHAAIGILPLLATCDRWDLGGVSTALHPDTGAATIVVYDGHPGGAGFAERGLRRAAALAAGDPGDGGQPASARAAARPACSRRSAATATSRWTRPARCGCSTSSSTSWPPPRRPASRRPRWTTRMTTTGRPPLPPPAGRHGGDADDLVF
jgi:DEAD/DEAH box helicase domain-containing protein